ncbi:hypothetical protein GQ53DRAFT_309189 [Thozetella sp. PMI_491]|nr:hypothetical protein GQ53DRAFT_309189 [Thozetella sp. PMI_491]
MRTLRIAHPLALARTAQSESGRQAGIVLGPSCLVHMQIAPASWVWKQNKTQKQRFVGAGKVQRCLWFAACLPCRPSSGWPTGSQWSWAWPYGSAPSPCPSRAVETLPWLTDAESRPRWIVALSGRVASLENALILTAISAARQGSHASESSQKSVCSLAMG